MLVAQNWLNHNHIFNSLSDAHLYSTSAIKEMKIEVENDLEEEDGVDMDSNIIDMNKSGFKSIFKNGDNTNHRYHLLASDESVASGSKSDTDIDT